MVFFPPSPEVSVDVYVVCFFNRAQVRAAADCLIAVDAVEAHIMRNVQLALLLAISIPQPAVVDSFIL